MIARMRWIREVCAELDSVHSRSIGQHWTDTEWTRHVKTAICTSCRNVSKGMPQQVKLFANGVDCPVEGGEWLFDVTCLLYDPEAGFLRRMPLIAESEWGGKDDISDDFEKLLVTRADVRVMVLDRGYWQEDVGAVIDLAEYVRNYESTQPDGVYLIAAWQSDGFKCWRIAGDGSYRFIH